MFEEDEGGGGEGGGMMRWLITYADLITLLLAFFIVLYALNRTQRIKFSLVAKALANNLDAKGSIIGQSPGPSFVEGQSGTSQPTEAQTLSKLQTDLKSAVNASGLAHSVSITSSQEGVQVSVADSLLFPSGSAAVSPQAIALLKKLGAVLNEVPNEVEVSGFTDSKPISTQQFSSNWQLSAVRAANVVQVLASVSGSVPGRYMISAFGQYRPVATNRDPAGRAQNRRVNIVVLKKAVASLVAPTGGP